MRGCLVQFDGITDSSHRMQMINFFAHNIKVQQGIKKKIYGSGLILIFQRELKHSQKPLIIELPAHMWTVYAPIMHGNYVKTP